jgi:hypothetical protein
MRMRLEGLIGRPRDLIGGSADTMYLPGHLRADLRDMLGTFLETDCFLEIVSSKLSRVSQLNRSITSIFRPYQR